jgi:hypothetical protein
MRLTRRLVVLGVGVLVISPLLAAFVGSSVGNGILHPMRLNAMRLEETQKMLERTGGTKEDFSVKAQDGVTLNGWKPAIRSEFTNPQRARRKFGL